MAVSNDSIVLQTQPYIDDDGNIVYGFQPNAKVELQAVDANNQLTGSILATTDDGTITDNGDGTYRWNMEELDLNPGVYAVLINGVAQDERKGVYIPTIRNIHRGQLDTTFLKWDGEKVTFVKGSIDTDYLKDRAVTSQKIALAAIIAELIQDGAVTPDKLQETYAKTSDLNSLSTSISSQLTNLFNMTSNDANNINLPANQTDFPTSSKVWGALGDLLSKIGTINTNGTNYLDILTDPSIFDLIRQLDLEIAKKQISSSAIAEKTLSRIIYNDVAVAPTGATGDTAPALPTFENNAAAAEVKRRFVWNQRVVQDKYLRLSVLAKLDVVGPTSAVTGIRMAHPDTLTYSEWGTVPGTATDWVLVTLGWNITNILDDDGLSPTMRSTEIDIEVKNEAYQECSIKWKHPVVEVLNGQQ